MLPPEINIATSRKKGAARSPVLDAGAGVTLLRYTNGVSLINTCTCITTERKKEVKHRRLQERVDRKGANFYYGITDLTEVDLLELDLSWE